MRSRWVTPPAPKTPYSKALCQQFGRRRDFQDRLQQRLMSGLRNAFSTGIALSVFLRRAILVQSQYHGGCGNLKGRLIQYGLRSVVIRAPGLMERVATRNCQTIELMRWIAAHVSSTVMEHGDNQVSVRQYRISSGVSTLSEIRTQYGFSVIDGSSCAIKFPISGIFPL